MILDTSKEKLVLIENLINKGIYKVDDGRQLYELSINELINLQEKKTN